jgi:hypothetical protein
MRSSKRFPCWMITSRRQNKAAVLQRRGKKAKIAMLCERSYDPLSRMLLKAILMWAENLPRSR